MKAWCVANPTKKKTLSGVNRFIVTWLAKEQDKGGASSNAINNKYETPRTKGNMDLLQKTINEFGGEA